MRACPARIPRLLLDDCWTLCSSCVSLQELNGTEDGPRGEAAEKHKEKKHKKEKKEKKEKREKKDKKEKKRRKDKEQAAGDEHDEAGMRALEEELREQALQSRATS